MGLIKGDFKMNVDDSVYTTISIHKQFQPAYSEVDNILVNRLDEVFLRKIYVIYQNFRANNGNKVLGEQDCL